MIRWSVCRQDLRRFLLPSEVLPSHWRVTTKGDNNMTAIASSVMSYRQGSISIDGGSTKATDAIRPTAYVAAYTHRASTLDVPSECIQTLWTPDEAERIGVAFIQAARNARVAEVLAREELDRNVSDGAAADLEDDQLDAVCRTVS